MKKRWGMVAAVAAASMVVMGLLGCSGSQEAQQKAPEQAADSASSGYEVTSKQDAGGTLLQFEDGTVFYAGKTMLVDLNENLTTGYAWTSSYETELVTVDSDESITAEDASQDGKQAAVGEGGSHLFSYSGISAGKVIITYKYAQPWEGGTTGTFLKLTATLGDDGMFQDVVITKEK